jgi:spore germination cell wall hydrolase CwlJ-like protein
MTPFRCKTMIYALLILAAPMAQADGTMVSFFPEDVEVEASRSSKTPFNVASLTEMFSSPTQERRAQRIDELKKDARRLAASPPLSLRNETALGCTAVAIFFEARGESRKGQRAVASVVLQRAKVPDRWGDTPCDVVRPVQFSFMQSRYGFPSITSQDGWRQSWARAINIAAQTLVEGPMPDLQGADHYHTRAARPRWRLAMPRVAAIGNHLFYTDPLSHR